MFDAAISLTVSNGPSFTSPCSPLPAPFFSSQVEALHASLRNMLEHLRALCARHPSASSSAIALHIVESVLPRWRHDLTPILDAAVSGVGYEGVRMDEGDDVGPLECENTDGADITINLIPRGHNWPAQPCRFKTRSSVGLGELQDFIYTHYHVSPVKVFTSSASRPGLGGNVGGQGQELRTDFELREYLTFCAMRQNGDCSADLELQMAMHAWGGFTSGVGGSVMGTGAEVPLDSVVEEDLRRFGLELDCGLLVRGGGG